MLATFVALSIATLTAYFGEPGGGVLHSLQRTAQEAFAPIETGASRALEPVRDFTGWAGERSTPRTRTRASRMRSSGSAPSSPRRRRRCATPAS